MNVPLKWGLKVALKESLNGVLEWAFMNESSQYLKQPPTLRDLWVLPRWAESAVLDRVVEKAIQTPGLLSKKEQHSNIYIFIEVT